MPLNAQKNGKTFKRLWDVYPISNSLSTLGVATIGDDADNRLGSLKLGNEAESTNTYDK